jgi:CRP-like cAMP-binding protein
MKTLTLEECQARDLHLYSVGICENIREEHLSKLKEAGEWLEADNEVIVADGMDQHYLYIIVEGEVEIFKFRKLTGKDQDEKQVFSTLTTGECFGEMAFLSGGLSSANVGAKGKVVVWRMSHENLLRFIDECTGGSQLVLNIAATLSVRVQDGNRRLLDITGRIGDEIEKAKARGGDNLEGVENELRDLMKAYQGMESTQVEEDFKPLLLAAALGVGGILFGAWQYFDKPTQPDLPQKEIPAEVQEQTKH